MATTAPGGAGKKNLEKEHFNIQNVWGNTCLIIRKQQYKRWDRGENVPVLQLWYPVGHLSIKLFFLNTLKKTFLFIYFFPDHAVVVSWVCVWDSFTLTINQAHLAIRSLPGSWSICSDSDRGVFVRFSGPGTRHATSDVVLYLASGGARAILTVRLMNHKNDAVVQKLKWGRWCYFCAEWWIDEQHKWRLKIKT